MDKVLLPHPLSPATTVIPLILINYGLLFLISKVSSLPENEVLLRSLVRVSPLYYLLIFGVLSPICEELTFRYGFNGIKNKYIYIIFTSILYAVMHLSSFSEILYAIPYFILGLTFAMQTISTIDSAVAQTIFSLVPVFAIPLAYLFHKEKITWFIIFGAFIAISGVIILIWRNSIANFIGL